MENKNIPVKNVTDSLSRTLRIKEYHKKRGTLSTNCFWKKFQLQEYQELRVFQSLGCKNTSIKNTKTSRKKSIAKKKGKITIECDEMWSFVEKKTNKQWIWLAIDLDSREIVGVHVGSRDHRGAEALWNSLPPVYRQCAVAFSDFWSAYQKVFPQKRHKAVGKETGKTNHIERFNNTMRQRISRLVRKTLSFSKKIENHIGAVWNFVHHYNAEIAPRLAAATTC